MLAGVGDYGNSLLDANGRLFFGTTAVSPVPGTPGANTGGAVYAMRFNESGLLTTPVQEAVLPPGERLIHMVTDGTLLCLLTSSGVRFCVVSDTLTVGPLIDLSRLIEEHAIEDDETYAPPDDALFLGNYCYVVYGNHLIQFNIGNFIEPLVPAWGHVDRLPGNEPRRRLVPVGRQGSGDFSIGAAISDPASGELWWQRKSPVMESGTAHVGVLSWGSSVKKRYDREAFEIRRRFGNSAGTINPPTLTPDSPQPEGAETDVAQGFAASFTLRREDDSDSEGPVLTSWAVGAVPVPDEDHQRVVECELPLIVRSAVTDDMISPVAQDMLEEYAWLHMRAREIARVTFSLGTQQWNKAEVTSVGLRPEGDDEGTGFYQGTILVALRLYGDPISTVVEPASISVG